MTNTLPYLMYLVRVILIIILLPQVSIIGQEQSGTVNTSTVKLVFYTIPRFVKKCDTVLRYVIHLNKNDMDIVDSVTLDEKITKYDQTKWIYKSPSGEYTIYRFKRIKPSKWFKELNDTYFHADCELVPILYFRYASEGRLKEYQRRGGVVRHNWNY